MLISIVTVVKNNNKHISRTLQSILEQTYKNIELIVIDGQSNDGTDHIVKKYFKQFKYINRKDKSVYDSLNFACKIAKGEFLGFLHSGDIYYDKNVITKFAKNLNKNVDLLCSNIIYFDDEYKITRYWKIPKTSFKDYPYKFPHTGMLYSKKIYKKFKYDENFKISSDSKYLIQLSRSNLVTKKKDIVSVCMFNRGLSTNISSMSLRMKEDFKFLKECYGAMFFFYYIIKVLYKFPSILISKKSIENHQRKLILTFKKLENKCTKKNINYLESLYYFNNIKMVNDINSFIHKKKNFVLSGLNLAFLGSYFSNKVIFYKNLYHWPDGYLPLIVSKSLNKFEKIAGRNLIRNLKLTKKIKYVHIFGNLNLNQKKIIRNLLKKKIVHTKLPYGSAGKLAQKCGKLKKNILYILTLPTPKQEIVAEILSIKNRNI
jgi:glycosyltransferase involved in cell wall biosynthesis